VFQEEVNGLFGPIILIPDNRILECAIHGEADLLITGDKKILQQREYKGVRIISLEEYLELGK